MGELSQAKLEVLRTLVEASPDAVLRSLLQALSSDGPYDAALAAVRVVVETEAQDRRVRNTVFVAVASLCRSSPFPRLTFPSRALALMWKGLKHEAPSETAQAAALMAEWREENSSPEVYDLLCDLALQALSERRAGYFADAAAACDAAGEDLAGQLIKCLSLSRIVRPCIHRLPDWLGRMTSEKTAELRLAYGDACAVADDAGPYFFEMLAAHLAEPWLILRVISGVMDRPTDAYLAASELSPFAERLLDGIDADLVELGRFSAAAGPPAARQTAERSESATRRIAEIEQCIALSPTGPWGRRVIGQKRTLALTIEAHLRAADDIVGKALPLQTIRLGPRTMKGIPRLTTDPDPAAIEKALTLLTFAHEVQRSAADGGFASTRAKVLETVEQRLDQYVEDLLDHLRTELEPGAENDHDRARAYLDIAADFFGLARDDKAAQIVRRRAAAA
jgi:hypothetical protein